MKAAVVLSLAAVAQGQSGAFCDSLLFELAKDSCRLSGSLSDAMEQQLDDSSYVHPTSQATDWTNCNEDAGVAVGKSHEEKAIAEISASEEKIKGSEASLAQANSDIQKYLSIIKGSQIELSQQRVRYDAEEASLNKWKNTRVTENTLHERAMAEYDSALAESEAFLLELQTLLNTDASMDGTLANIMATSNAGNYNAGFYDNIYAEFETLHSNNRAEYTHMENEKNRQASAFATRDTALVNLICVSMNEMDNSDDPGADGHDPNEVLCTNAGTRASGQQTNALFKINQAEAELTTAKASLQDSYKAQQDFTETVRLERAALAALKKKHEAKQKRFQERITAYHEVHSMCVTMQSMGSFIQLDQEVNTAAIFVQISTLIKEGNPITTVQKALLATAEETGNKQLALFATSLSSKVSGTADGALDKVISLVRDMITDLQKQIDLEHKGSWCENQQAQVASAVHNANSYVDSLQQQLDKLNADVAAAQTRQSTLNQCVYDENQKIQTLSGEMKVEENDYLAEKQALKESITGFGQMKDKMASAPQSDMIQQFMERITGFVGENEQDMQVNEAEYKTYVADSTQLMKQYKTNLARCEAELGFVQDNIARWTQALQENNAAMTEASQSQSAALEMQQTFINNCETQDGLQIANGASALEKCAMTCHTVNALELACHELAGPTATGPSFISDECVLCPAADGATRTVYKVKSGDSTSFVCDGDAEEPNTPGPACTGAELMDGENCSWTSAASAPVFHSDVACDNDVNAISECDMLESGEGGSCDPDVGLVSGGNLVASCRSETISVAR